MGAYVLRRNLVFVFVVIYIAAALWGPRLGRSEFYPFFSWSLFSRTHSVRHDTVLLVQSINGHELDKPKIYYYLPRRLGIRTEVRLSKLLADLARALEAGDRDAYRHYVKMIKSEYFRGFRAARFQIAQISYNPIERLRTGEFEVTKVLSEDSL